MMTQHEQDIVSIDPDLSDLIPIFLQNRAKELPELERMISTRDFHALASYGHQLKGTALNYGFHRLGSLGLALEEAGKANDDTTLDRLLVEVRDHLSRVKVIYRS